MRPQDGREGVAAADEAAGSGGRAGGGVGLRKDDVDDIDATRLPWRGTQHGHAGLDRWEG